MTDETIPHPEVVPPLDLAQPTYPPKRKKGIYIGAPACFKLELACKEINDAFCERGYGIYVVGSVLERPDWRDVDLRMILSDEGFKELFPNAIVFDEGKGGTWEFDQRWLLLTTMISDRLSNLTGLPIDFQFQPVTYANARHKGMRSAIGVHHESRESFEARHRESACSEDDDSV